MQIDLTEDEVNLLIGALIDSIHESLTDREVGETLIDRLEAMLPE